MPVRSAIAVAAVLLTFGSASASQCPALIKQVTDATGNRLDAAGYSARQLAAEAQKLHNEGKHDESMAKAEEAAKAAGVTLNKK
jgi:hypothetical protein